MCHDNAKTLRLPAWIQGVAWWATISATPPHSTPCVATCKLKFPIHGVFPRCITIQVIFPRSISNARCISNPRCSKVSIFGALPDSTWGQLSLALPSCCKLKLQPGDHLMPKYIAVTCLSVRWTSQKCKYQYRDHLVGRLTTYSPAASSYSFAHLQIAGGPI